jgi:putative ABC transport system permease protein
MTNAVMSRQITLQREQIAMLKACGFSNRQVGWHYFKFSLAIVVVGTALGAGGGVVLGHKLVEMYHLFFRSRSSSFCSRRKCSCSPCWSARSRRSRGSGARCAPR